MRIENMNRIIDDLTRDDENTFTSHINLLNKLRRCNDKNIKKELEEELNNLKFHGIDREYLLQNWTEVKSLLEKIVKKV